MHTLHIVYSTVFFFFYNENRRRVCIDGNIFNEQSAIKMTILVRTFNALWVSTLNSPPYFFYFFSCIAINSLYYTHVIIITSSSLYFEVLLYVGWMALPAYFVKYYNEARLKITTEFFHSFFFTSKLIRTHTNFVFSISFFFEGAYVYSGRYSRTYNVL